MPVQDPPDVERMKEALALIPVECYDNPRHIGIRYATQDVLLYALGIVGICLTDNPFLLILLWLYTGGIIGTLFIIAHDAAHGALFKSKTLNRWVGQGLMLPGFHVFNAWVYGHNQVHHAYTCNEDKDFVWHPTNEAEYRAMGPLGRLMHRIYWSWFGTGIYYLIEIWVKKMLLFKDFPKRQGRKVAKDRAIVYAFMGLSALALITIGAAVSGGSIGYGVWMWFKVIIMPFLLFNYAMAVTIHLHHIHPDIPWFHGEDWEYLTGVLSSTVVHVPKWLNVFTHNIFIHMPHHLDARIPFYNLPKAADALRGRYGGQYREVPLNVFDYFRNTAACKIYDFDAQKWLRYDELSKEDATHMKGLGVLLAFSLLLPALAEVPQNADEVWASFDPRAEELEIELLEETIQDGIIVRHVRYLVGNFGGRKPRVAAWMAFPAGRAGLPGIVQIHGGGQRALAHQVEFWARHGYACIAVNWGEHPIGRGDVPRTDWDGLPAGFYDPKHHNDIDPAPGTLHRVAHPWNSSWILYSAAARRALTLLERDPHVNPERLGVMGHSMGGRLTVLTATDPRVKAASPSVGGSGFLYMNLAGIPNSARRMKNHLDLYRRTVGGQSYWPRIRCPLLFLGATNDFNSPMEFVALGMRLMPPDHPSASSFTPHMNHRFTADNFAARIRWFDTHLKGRFAFPNTPKLELTLNTTKGIPQVSIQPDPTSAHALKSVQIYYGFDRDPRARFWRSAATVRGGDRFHATCPVVDIGEPLFVFANITYETEDTLAMPRGYHDTRLLTVSSPLRRVYPKELRASGVLGSGRRERLIDDFQYGWRDWSLIATGNREHWNVETHKVADPSFFGPAGAKLGIRITTSGPDETLAVVLDTDRWRGYTGRKPQRYTALIDLQEGENRLEIPMNAFKNPEGDALESYDFVTSLILTPGWKERPDEVKSGWTSDVPTLQRIEWIGGRFETRPRPYLRTGGPEIDPDAAFESEFDEAVRKSLEDETRDQRK